MASDSPTCKNNILYSQQRDNFEFWNEDFDKHDFEMKFLMKISMKNQVSYVPLEWLKFTEELQRTILTRVLCRNMEIY